MSIISEVNVRPIRPREGLVAIVSVVIETELGQFIVNSIGLHTKLKGGYRITYPNKKSSGSEIQLFNPLSKELQEAIEQRIFDEYEELLAKDA